MSKSNRVCDYFLHVNARLQARPVDSAGPPVFEPSLVARFPLEDYPDAAFPKECPMFCFPSGIQLRESPLILPDCFNFSLTEGDGTRLYGACLTFFEPASEEIRKATGGENSKPLFAPVAFCLISHWPFYSQLLTFLQQLHSIAKIPPSAGASAGLGGLPFPYERALVNLIMETPLPPAGVLEVEYRLLQRFPPLLYRRPPPNARGLRDFPLHAAFQWLSVDNFLTLFSAVLCERRILLLSSQYSRLTIAAETLCHFIYPFYWRHMLIPLLPARLEDFVAAPFPYLVGLHTSDLPDDLMLENVVCVFLDENRLSCTAPISEIVPALPEKFLAPLQKSLKKHFNNADSTLPLPISFPVHSLSEVDLESHFLSFFIRIFSNYRQFLEAPSEQIIEKFNKAEFVAEFAATERSEIPKRQLTHFLQDLLDTQAFQCFIDERYEILANSGAQEILFFNESIEAAKGKISAFLADTTNLHQAEKKFIVASPVTEDLQKNAVFAYYNLPNFPPFQNSLTAPPREIPQFAGESASFSSSRSRTINMKFFTDKSIYSQQFHALRVKSSKQDAHFKGIRSFFQKAQAQEEMRIREFQLLVDSQAKAVDTGTSIDPVWRIFSQRRISDQFHSGQSMFQFTRENLCVPLYSQCATAELELRGLFQEANILENKASKGKSITERAKSASNFMAARHEALKKTLRRDHSPSPGELQKLIAAKSDAEEAELLFEESESSFHTIVAEYEERMPLIMDSIREINKQRMDMWKARMNAWAQEMRGILEKEISGLAQLQEAVNAVNVEKDAASFGEARAEFWNLPPEKKKEEKQEIPAVLVEPPEPSKSSAPSPNFSSNNSSDFLPPIALPASAASSRSPSPVRSDSSDLICYPLYLWGAEGFQSALGNSAGWKKALKEFIAALDEWAALMDGRSKKLQQVAKQLEIPAAGPGLSQQGRIMDILTISYSSQSARCHEFSRLLGRLSQDLAISRGELKAAIKRYSEHKSKLEKEVAAALQERFLAQEKKAKCLKALQAVQEMAPGSLVAGNPVAALGNVSAVSERQLEAHYSLLYRAEQEYRSAASACALAERAAANSEIQRDISMARLLALAEKKEKAMGLETKKVLQALQTGYEKILVEPANHAEVALMAQLQAVDVEKDLTEFLDSFSHATPGKPLTAENSLLAGRFNGDCALFYSPCMNLLTRSQSLIKILEVAMESSVDLEDSDLKGLKKGNFIVKMHFPSMKAGLDGFTTFLEKFTGISEDFVRNLKPFQGALEKVRNSIKTLQKNKEKIYGEQEKTVKKALEEREKAIAEEKKAEFLYQAAQKKVEQFQVENPGGGEEGKSSIFGMRGNAGSPLENLKGKEAAAWKELEKLRAATIAKRAALESAESRRAEEFLRLLRDVEALERLKWSHLKENFFVPLGQKRQNHLEKQAALAGNLRSRVEEMSIFKDLREFLSTNGRRVEAPLKVLEYFKRKEKKIREIKEKTLSSRALQDGRKRLATVKKEEEKEKPSMAVLPAVDESLQSFRQFSENSTDFPISGADEASEAIFNASGHENGLEISVSEEKLDENSDGPGQSLTESETSEIASVVDFLNAQGASLENSIQPGLKIEQEEN